MVFFTFVGRVVDSTVDESNGVCMRYGIGYNSKLWNRKHAKSRKARASRSSSHQDKSTNIIGDSRSAVSVTRGINQSIRERNKHNKRKEISLYNASLPISRRYTSYHVHTRSPKAVAVEHCTRPAQSTPQRDAVHTRDFQSLAAISLTRMAPGTPRSCES